jgi:hypothetical protein
MREKCVQNAISLFIGLLTTIMMTRLLKLNTMNLPMGRASEHGPEEKMRKKMECFNLVRTNYELYLQDISDNYAVIWIRSKLRLDNPCF